MNDRPRVQLVDTITCPYCWSDFPPEAVHWISEHGSLVGDSVLGPDEKRRFLPSRFDPHGNALDEKGTACRSIACPQCHGLLARGLLEMRPLFLSILGAPRSGKSFYLGSMLKQVQEVLDGRFALRFENSLPEQNQKIVGYRDTLFDHDDPNGWKWLDKTQSRGVVGLYRDITLNGEDKTASIPCMFAIQPQKQHAAFDRRFDIARMLCLYDCAGEYFVPGNVPGNGDTLVVDHLANSDAMLFVFDPFQETKFRQACAAFTDDPQVTQEQFRVTYDQSKVLSLAAQRVRDRKNRPMSWKYDKPFIVLVNKFDGWHNLLDGCAARLRKVVGETADGRFGIDLTAIAEISGSIEKLLRQHAPSMVNAASSFADDVIYLPVSATGGPPTFVQEPLGDGGPENKSGLAFRAGSIHPKWVEIPILYVLSRRSGATGNVSLIPAGRSRPSAGRADEQSHPRRNRAGLG